MGTNFYLRNKCLHEAAQEAIRQEEALCAKLGGNPTRSDSLSEHYTVEPEFLHIGKSSSGWYFNLCIYPQFGIKELDDWRKAWQDPNYEIVDEYGRVLTPEEMAARILERRGDLTKERMEGLYKAGALTRGTVGLDIHYGLIYGLGDRLRGKEGPYTITSETQFS